MEKILITGADGFIGSHLTEILCEQNYEIYALAQYNSFNNTGWLSQIKNKNKINIIFGDIRDPFFCKKITKNIDIVFHLAALIAIPYSYEAPSSYFNTNVLGTLNICEAAKSNDVKRIINISTSEVYGTAIYTPIDEKHPLQPQSPYSASKISAEAVSMSYYNAFDLPVTVIRPFNTYGPRQSARAIIPTIITQILKGKKEIKLGSLSPTRDFNYVSDTCMTMLEISKNQKSIGKTLNIGTGSEISIGGIAEKIKAIMGSDVKIIEDKIRIRPEKSEVFRLVCDENKTRQIIGKRSFVSIDDGLKITIDWFKDPENLGNYNAYLYSI